MKAVLVGNFSDPRQTPDGQLIKTAEFLAAVERTKQFDIFTVDSSKSRATLPFKMWSALRSTDVVFVLPGARSLLLVGSLLRVFRIFTADCPPVHLVAVGGWLSRLGREGLFRWALKGFDTISTETDEISEQLGPGLPRTAVLPNFRLSDQVPHGERPAVPLSLRLVFVSRVTRSKGIFEALELVRSLQNSSVPVSFDVYGPLLFSTREEEFRFFAELEALGEFVHYQGMIDPARVITTVANYDCVLLPSSYQGEGFSGIIVESLLAGTPVIARDHLFFQNLNDTYDFGLVTVNNFVSEGSGWLIGGHHVAWRTNWVARQRGVDLERRLGFQAFESWLREIL